MRRITPTIDAEGMHCVITGGPKRQITLPHFVQEALDIAPGDKVLIQGHLPAEAGDRLRLAVKGDRIVLRLLYR